MPIYYKFTFTSDIQNVFLDVRSRDRLCTIVSVQSFDCPVYDIGEIGIRQGHYQTMASIASFNVYVKIENLFVLEMQVLLFSFFKASEFRRQNTFLLVFLVQPTDADCLDDQQQTMIQPSGIIDVQREKKAIVTLHLPTNCMRKRSYIQS